MTETQSIPREPLFYASCLALLVTGMTFSIRAGLLQPLGIEFELTNTQLGYVASAAFLGFPLATTLGGPLVDVVGMGRLLYLALIGHIAGIFLTIFAGGFISLLISTLLVGIANGLIEAACNPLVGTMYAEKKTKMFNRFHVWFPSGIVAGGLVSYFMTQAGLGWKLQMASMLVPAVIYGVMFIGKKFPPTERVATGVSTADMFKECLRPLFLFMVFCMFLTATTELATGQWIESLLANVGVPAIILLVFINGIMAIGRLFAGPVVHRLAPAGVLLFSAVFSALGLFWLSYATGFMAFAAAGIFAVGVTYFWPTMLGFVSEYLPRTGALGLSLIGGAGMFSVSLLLPVIGQVMDSQILSLVPGGYTMEQLQGAVQGSEAAAIWDEVSLKVGSTTLRYMTILPVILIALFTGLKLYISKRQKESESI